MTFLLALNLTKPMTEDHQGLYFQNTAAIFGNSDTGRGNRMEKFKPDRKLKSTGALDHRLRLDELHNHCEG